LFLASSYSSNDVPEGDLGTDKPKTEDLQSCGESRGLSILSMLNPSTKKRHPDDDRLGVPPP
jgi:hypothetical protein